MNGEVIVTSELNNGASFKIEIPVNAEYPEKVNNNKEDLD